MDYKKVLRLRFVNRLSCREIAESCGDCGKMHMARPNGRFCGAKRPKCEAEQPLGFD